MERIYADTEDDDDDGGPEELAPSPLISLLPHSLLFKRLVVRSKSLRHTNDAIPSTGNHVFVCLKLRRGW